MLMAIFLVQCANPVAPRGGPRDSDPPQVDSTRSTPNFVTNFREDRIVISFDEWVKLNDAFNQIVYSPPFNEPPDVRLTRKKGVMVVFNDSLRANTTYTINFGNAIQDITESNPARDLRYVFSTGDYIDSLEVEGIVIDALTGKGSEDVLLMLYENPYDSIVYLERPLYFAKTDNVGQFKIQNVKSSTFKIFALVDNNFNYLFDLENERIGFQEENVLVNDTTVNRFLIQTFEEEKPLRVISRDVGQFGKVTLLFNRAVLSPGVSSDINTSSAFVRHDEDFLEYWYMTADTGDYTVFVETGGLRDSIQVDIEGISEFLGTNPRFEVIDKPVRPSVSANNNSSRRPTGRTTGKSQNSSSNNSNVRFQQATQTLAITDIHPDEPARLYFNHPALKIESDSIILLEDSLKVPVVIDSFSLEDANRELAIFYPWKEGMRYELAIKQGAVEDIFGLSVDSSTVNLSVKERKDYGGILSQLDNMDSTITYIVELYSPSDELVDRYTVAGVSSHKKDYLRLLPGSYELRIIEDANNNGRWDSGSYEAKRQPEKVIIEAVQPLRPNWEVEANIIFNDR